MTYSLLVSLLLLLIATDSGWAQIGYPGQYPGQYPSGGGGGLPFPMPGRRTRTNPNTQPTRNFTGTLRKVSTSELSIESDDKRVVTIALYSTTRYFKSQADADSSTNKSSGTAKRADFQIGDEVSIDATEDDNGNFRAVNVAMIKDGAKESATNAPTKAPTGSPRSSSTADSGDDDRPKLRRAGPQDGDKQAASANPSAPAATSDETPPMIASSRDSATSVTPPAPPLDADDAGKPTLHRGKPTQVTSSAETSGAKGTDTRPSLHAEDVNGVTRLPDPPQVADGTPGARGFSQIDDEDPVIAHAREEAFSFSETLPNYMVKQVTTRYGTASARGGRTSWQAFDVVTADVISENGKETYTNVLINGKQPKDAVEKTGAWSTGEFSSVLQDIFSPDTDADFHNKRSTTIVNRAAFRYDFSVEQRNSHWDVHTASQTYTPAYSGAMWIDKTTSRVLRIEMAAAKIPQDFPLDTVESAVDYDFVLIGDGKYLLPVHSEALSCHRGTGDCSRNVIDFRNYKKFGAETSITFGDAK